jgi:mono/diheme cytochrome c family protein
MKYIFFPFLVTSTLFATSSYITPLEYASQLYNNPRGIGCGNCHGEHGEGLVIARYKHKDKPREFVGPAINKVPYEQFQKILQKRVKGMPRYYLTQGEIRALYLYLHQNLIEEKPQ